jgi:hypothetical protein
MADAAQLESMEAGKPGSREVDKFVSTNPIYIINLINCDL